MSFALMAESTGDFVIDEIKAIVEGPLHTDVILDSDVKRRSFDGAEHDINDLVLEYAKDQRAEQIGVTIEKEDVDRYLHSMAHGEDVSQETLAMQAKSFGFDTLDEFYEDLKRLYRANSAMEVEVRALLTVSEQEAQAYCDKNPAYKDGIFYLQTALVPLDEHVSKKKQKQELENPTNHAYKLDWSEPFDILYKELAQDKEFIRTMEIGQIKAVELADGFQIYRLRNNIKPHVLTFQERRKDIINKLRDEKFKEVFKKYNNDILQDIQVTRF